MAIQALFNFPIQTLSFLKWFSHLTALDWSGWGPFSKTQRQNSDHAYCTCYSGELGYKGLKEGLSEVRLKEVIAEG